MTRPALFLLATLLITAPAAWAEEAVAAAEGENESASEQHPALLDPSKATEQAPDQFYAEFDTTKGTFVVE